MNKLSFLTASWVLPLAILLGAWCFFYALWGLYRGEISTHGIRHINRVKEPFLFWSVFSIFLNLGILLLMMSSGTVRPVLFFLAIVMLFLSLGICALAMVLRIARFFKIGGPDE